MTPDQTPSSDRERRDHVARVGGDVLTEHLGHTLAVAMKAASIGLGYGLVMRAGRLPEDPDETKPMAVAIVVSGIVPEHVFKQIGDLVRGHLQDQDTSKQGRTVFAHDRDKDGPMDGPLAP